MLLKQPAAHLWPKVPSLLLQAERCGSHCWHAMAMIQTLLMTHICFCTQVVSCIRAATLAGGFGYCPSESDLGPCWSDAEIRTFFSLGVATLLWLTRLTVVCPCTDSFPAHSSSEIDTSVLISKVFFFCLEEPPAFKDQLLNINSSKCFTPHVNPSPSCLVNYVQSCSFSRQVLHVMNSG